MVDPRTLVNSKKNDLWARNFLRMIEDEINNADSDVITLTLGDKLRNPRDYILLKDNLEYILGYAKHFIGLGFKHVSAAGISNHLIRFMSKIQKPTKKITRKDIEKFLEEWSFKYSKSYVFTMKRKIKPFFRWVYGMDVKDGYPEVVDWIYCGKKSDMRRDLPEILTMEEIQKMIEVCSNFRDRAIVSILYESGCRASEILDLKINGLVFDEYGIKVVVNGKTGSRRLRLVSCVHDVKQWLNVHPRKNEDDAALFCALTKNNMGNPLGDSSLDFIISQIKKRASLKKRVYPHLFRHTRATHLAKHLSEQELKVYFGWSKTSNMASVYIHLSGKDVENKILALNGIKTRDTGKPPVVPSSKCYKCGEINSIGNKFCFKCDAPLTSKSIQKVENVKKIISEVTVHILDQMEKRKIGEGDLQNIVEEWYHTGNKNQ